MAGELMAAEIREQPDVFRRLLVRGRDAIASVAHAIRRRRPRFVIFAARGTSDHAALYGKYLVETRLALPAGLASPSTMTIYGARPEMGDVLFIAVSQSGASPDLVEPLTRARAAGAVTLAVTNAPDSPLERAAEYRIDVLAGPERAVAATKTYTGELLSLYLLVEELARDGGPGADDLPSLAEELLGLEPRVAEIAVRYRFAEQVVITARGFNYPTALEAALKLMETGYLVAHGFSGADLLHGPMAIIQRGFPVVAIVPNGPGGAALQPVLERLREQGADTWVIGERGAPAPATVRLELPPLGPEILSPLLTILPLQQFAWHLARQRGIDPDRPAGLRKVTETW
ncbi:MAG: SIS domain-containing protein [Chloroflexi bacterium]|nr:SIS domain-containing protein [Chloroflexota bacterium]